MAKVWWFLLITAIFTSGAMASIQDQIDNDTLGSVTVYGGTYLENVDVYKSLSLMGIDNPALIAADESICALKLNATDLLVSGFTVSGPNGIDISNCSPVGPSVLYNNIYGTSVGLSTDNVSPVDARYNYWGDGGSGDQRGRPGVDNNSPIVGSGVTYTPWLTAPVTNGVVSLLGMNAFHLDNPQAGIEMEVSCDSSTEATGGSASYLYEPYASESLPGYPVKWYSIFLDGDAPNSPLEDGTATLTVRFSDDDVSSVDKNSLKLYLWNGGSWIEADGEVLYANSISGEFPASALSGSTGVAPILALMGTSSASDYTVTILPEQNPQVPLEQKPVLTTFSITSDYEISAVYYQMDSYSHLGWTEISSNLTGVTTWSYDNWTISDDLWNSLADGTHTLYFRFTRIGAGDVGDGGEVRWQFSKARADPVTPVTLIKPNGGETLNRTRFPITWTMPNPESVAYVELRYSTDGGATYPYYIMRLTGGATSYDWMSPNIMTNEAKVRVLVGYDDGSEESDESDGTFSIVKGYSFHAWKPSFGFTSFKVLAKPPYSFHAG